MIAHTADPPACPGSCLTQVLRFLSHRSSRVLVLLSVVIALSAADLYLTLMYTSTIGMPELNPFARALLRHGTVLDLVLWKTGTLALCAGILIRLRHRRAAEIGAWIAFATLLVLTWQWLAYTNLHHVLANTEGLDYQTAAAGEPHWVEINHTLD